MRTVTALLAVLALLLTVGAAVNPPRVPIWVPVLLLCLVALLGGLGGLGWR